MFPTIASKIGWKWITTDEIEVLLLQDVAAGREIERIALCRGKSKENLANNIVAWWSAEYTNGLKRGDPPSVRDFERDRHNGKYVYRKRRTTTNGTKRLSVRKAKPSGCHPPVELNGVICQRRRHRQRPKFNNEPVGLADLYADFYCDLPEHVRRTLPSEVLRAERQRVAVKADLSESDHFETMHCQSVGCGTANQTQSAMQSNTQSFSAAHMML